VPVSLVPILLSPVALVHQSLVPLVDTSVPGLGMGTARGHDRGGMHRPMEDKMEVVEDEHGIEEHRSLEVKWMRIERNRMEGADVIGGCGASMEMEMEMQRKML